MNGVTIPGLSAVLKKIPDGVATHAMIMRVLQRCALRIVVESQTLAPQKTRALFRSLKILKIDPALLQVTVGSDLNYALWVDEGTGVFGPHGQAILPVNAQVLAWPVSETRLTGAANESGDSDYAYQSQVAGQPGQHFLERAVELARGKFSGEVAAGFKGTFDGNVSES